MGFLPRHHQMGYAIVHYSCSVYQFLSGSSLYFPVFGIACLKFKAKAGPTGVRPQMTFLRLQGTIEKHVFDPHMIMEIFQMRNLGDSAANVSMNRVSCVSGKRNSVGMSQCSGLQTACNSQTTGGIRLKDIDCSRFQHITKIRSMVAKLARSDGYWRVLPDESQLVDVIERHRFFEVCHSLFSEETGKVNGLLSRISTVCIHKELGIRPYGLANGFYPGKVLFLLCTPVLPNFHLHFRNSLFYPAGKLFYQLDLTGGCKSTTAIDGNTFAVRAQ